jgi:dTDP-4-amino-4,6-dideoxygalactose transaminase
MIRLARPAIGPDEVRAVVATLESGDLVQGARVLDFERAVVRITGLPHAVAVSSGTAALHLALVAMGVGPHDEVLVPDFTFPATANAVEAAGARVVVGDVRGDTWNLDLSRAPSARVTMPVDCFGLPADLPAGPVVEDAACALGASRPGGLADVACLSFHPRKVVTTGEGGMVLCRDGDLAGRIRRLRDHGRDGAVFAGWGINLRMTDVAASLGLAQVARLPELIAERARLAADYRARLAADARLRLQQVPTGLGHSWQTFAVRLEPGFDRDRCVAALRARGVEAGVATYALHLLDHHRSRHGLRAADFPEADALGRRGLALPLYPGLSPGDVGRVCDALDGALAEAAVG